MIHSLLMQIQKLTTADICSVRYLCSCIRRKKFFLHWKSSFNNSDGYRDSIALLSLHEILPRLENNDCSICRENYYLMTKELIGNYRKQLSNIGPFHLPSSSFLFSTMLLWFRRLCSGQFFSNSPVCRRFWKQLAAKLRKAAISLPPLRAQKKSAQKKRRKKSCGFETHGLRRTLLVCFFHFRLLCLQSSAKCAVLNLMHPLGGRWETWHEAACCQIVPLTRRGEPRRNWRIVSTFLMRLEVHFVAILSVCFGGATLFSFTGDWSAIFWFVKRKRK